MSRKIGSCANCPREHVTIWAKGLCRTCYRYERAHGVPRPAHLWANHCFNCGSDRGIMRVGRCAGCYHYRLTHGVEKPKHKWSKSECRGGCGKTLVKGKDKRRKGMCTTCYERTRYQYRNHGRLKRQPVRCLCGKVATHTPWVHKGTLPLCDQHYEEFIEDQRMYERV